MDDKNRTHASAQQLACFSGGIGSMRTRLRHHWDGSRPSFTFQSCLSNTGSRGDETPPSFLIPLSRIRGLVHRLLDMERKSWRCINEVNGSEISVLRAWVLCL